MEDDFECFVIKLIVENVGPYVKNKIYTQTLGKNIQIFGIKTKFLIQNTPTNL